jgi:hypothetical protein
MKLTNICTWGMPDARSGGGTGKYLKKDHPSPPNLVKNHHTFKRLNEL